MKIFLAGATGVIGSRLLKLMVDEGHEVAGMTRSEYKLEEVSRAGAAAILCDVFDVTRLNEEVRSFAPDLVMHQLTDLPDEIGRIREFVARNSKIRSQGTHNLILAAKANGAHIIAQSIAWRGGSVEQNHENAVLEVGGTVVKYGQFYGPGTYYEQQLPPNPRIYIDTAARQTMELLSCGSGTWELIEPS